MPTQTNKTEENFYTIYYTLQTEENSNLEPEQEPEKEKLYQAKGESLDDVMKFLKQLKDLKSYKVFFVNRVKEITAQTENITAEIVEAMSNDD